MDASDATVKALCLIVQAYDRCKSEGVPLDLADACEGTRLLLAMGGINVPAQIASGARKG